MLNQDGTFSFLSELMTTVDALVDEYEAVKGPLANDLERGLVISYMLGAMRCDLDLIWETLGSWSVFGTLHPRTVFEDCVPAEAALAEERMAQVREMLRQRGWLDTESA
ncbi:MAG: hypothetical protein ACYC5M_17470 [Anaerolineae bacterium]